MMGKTRSLDVMPVSALLELAAAIEAELKRRDVCEHGVPDGEYCRPCNLEYKRAAAEYESEFPGE